MIQKVMTPNPHTIGKDLSIRAAFDCMREHAIRHLPVESEGRLVGILTDRDIKLAKSIRGAENLLVQDVMTPDPYVVPPETLVDEVVVIMAERKLGSAIIQNPSGKVIGIFTAVDALRTLSDILNKDYRSS